MRIEPPVQHALHQAQLVARLVSPRPGGMRPRLLFELRGPLPTARAPRGSRARPRQLPVSIAFSRECDARARVRSMRSAASLASSASARGRRSAYARCARIDHVGEHIHVVVPAASVLPRKPSRDSSSGPPENRCRPAPCTGSATGRIRQLLELPEPASMLGVLVGASRSSSMWPSRMWRWRCRCWSRSSSKDLQRALVVVGRLRVRH